MQHVILYKKLMVHMILQYAKCCHMMLCFHTIHMLLCVHRRLRIRRVPCSCALRRVSVSFENVERFQSCQTVAHMCCFLNLIS